MLLEGLPSRSSVGSGVSSIMRRSASHLHCVQKKGCRATGSKSDSHCLKYINSILIKFNGVVVETGFQFSRSEAGKGSI